MADTYWRLLLIMARSMRGNHYIDSKDFLTEYIISNSLDTQFFSFQNPPPGLLLWHFTRHFSTFYITSPRGNHLPMGSSFSLIHPHLRPVNSFFHSKLTFYLKWFSSSCSKIPKYNITFNQAYKEYVHIWQNFRDFRASIHISGMVTLVFRW